MSACKPVSSVHSDSQKSGRGSIIVLSIAAFIVVTTEFIIVGLLPALARELNISIARAGQLVTLFALTVAVVGPFLTAWLSNVERRSLFTWILIAFAGCNAMSALSPNYELLAISRLVPAALLAVFWGTASDTASQLVEKSQAGKAVSHIYLGVSAALMLGVPLGTVAADLVGWRGTFWVLAGLSLSMAVALYVLMPRVNITERESLKSQSKILKNPSLLANLALSLIIFTGMFASYTYLADILEKAGEVPASHVGWWLMGFGTVGLLGNHLAGRFADSHLSTATVVCCIALAAGALGALFLAGIAATFLLALAVWAISHTALFPLCQVRVMNSAPGSKAFAGTLNISVANAGIGAGAMLGGWVISISDLAGIGVLTAALAILGAGAAFLVPKLISQKV